MERCMGFKTKDGTMYESEFEARKHEFLEDVMKILKEKHKDKLNDPHNFLMMRIAISCAFDEKFSKIEDFEL